MSNPTCNACNAQLPSGANFCSECGSREITTAEQHAVKIQAGFDEHKLELLQDDQSSPLFSMTTFEELGLPEDLLNGIRMMNWKKPSRIQCATLPHILRSSDNVIGQSQSGTGKTGCFGLGLLSRVDVSLKRPQALVIAPTRELARQITDELRRMAKYMKAVKIIACIPGYDFSGGILAQVVVGTAGRVKDAIDRHCFDLSNIRLLVLDEADNMLLDTKAGGGGLAAMAMQIKKRCPRDTQILLFSATYPPKVRQFCMAIAPNAKKFSIADQKSLNLNYIKQSFVMLPTEEAKFNFLIQVYEFCDINQSVIFVNTREAARNLAERMRAKKYSVALLQAEMPYDQRDMVIESFRKSMTRVLIATNVISRGLDVVMVSVVVNYEMPYQRGGSSPDFETYIHRVGRCGRFGRPGIAINLISTQKDAQCLDAISSHYQIEMQEMDRPEAFSDVFDRVQAETVAEVPDEEFNAQQGEEA